VRAGSGKCIAAGEYMGKAHYMHISLEGDLCLLGERSFVYAVQVSFCEHSL